jgi:hypothetical protein
MSEIDVSKLQNIIYIYKGDSADAVGGGYQGQYL